MYEKKRYKVQSVRPIKSAEVKLDKCKSLCSEEATCKSIDFKHAGSQCKLYSTDDVSGSSEYNIFSAIFVLQGCEGNCIRCLFPFNIDTCIIKN